VPSPRQPVRHLRPLNPHDAPIARRREELRQLLLGKLLLEERVQRAQERLLRTGLRGLAPDEVRDDRLDLGIHGRRKRRLQARDLGYPRRALDEELLRSEMLDQRIEAGVLGDDVEERARVLAGERANVVGDVEVQGVRAGGLEDHVLGAGAEGLEGGRRAALARPT